MHMDIQTKKVTVPAAKHQSHWTLFSNHAHVLLCLDREQAMVLRDVAMQVGITERAVQNIVADLELGGVITRFKEGRCNRYKINRRVKLRHPIESHRSVGELLDFVRKD